MHVILGIIGGLAGLAADEGFGALLGLVAGILVAEVLAQRRRIAALEKIAGSQAKAADSGVVFRPVEESGEAPEKAGQPEGMPPLQPRYIAKADGLTKKRPLESLPGNAEKQYSTPFDGFFAGLGTGVTTISSMIGRFFTGGNVVLKIGVVILFFGVAFLLKYAAQRDLVPLEFRLICVAAGGFLLLATGWQLRRRTFGYGLILQGGGIGVLYLVIYAAARLYDLLPLPLSLAVMISLVLLSSLLAIMQEAKSLAMAGIIGGFLAPVLMSTGDGSHILLFSYYSLLNIGILLIAWFKSWRELNLLGFFFTFVIATVWGYAAYQPQNFSTTEPFLIFFFLLYIVVSVLFAHRQPLELKGYIDGPMVFGLPLAVSSLQYCLVRDYEYGMAISAFVLGMFYTLLAVLLWRRLQGGMRMLAEVFLSLGIVFSSLTIPLALDGQLTSAIWALEGAAMVWVGVRQDRLHARLSALLLQCGAACFFIAEVWYPFGALAFLNHFFFGCLCISLAALFTSCYLEKVRDRLRSWEGFLPLPLLIWGLLWWYFGGLREADRHYPVDEFANIVLLFCSASTMLMTMVARRFSCRQLILSQSLFQPAMVALVPIALLSLGFNSHLASGWGIYAWPIALFTGYRLLSLVEDQWPRGLSGIWHPLNLWLVLFLLSHETAWLAGQFLGPAATWQAISWGLLPAVAVLSLVHWGARMRWPVGKFYADYLGLGCTVIAFLLLLWNLWCLTLPGDPFPISYLPLVNPLEMIQIFVIVSLFFWSRGVAGRGTPLPLNLSVQTVNLLLGLAGFSLLNATAARSVHFFGGVAYTPSSLYHSVIFQSTLAALWGLLALVITVLSAKFGSRRSWCAGALLLAMVVLKLFLVDLSGTGTVARIISFLVVGILMLIIGYFSPLPPKNTEEEK